MLMQVFSENHVTIGIALISHEVGVIRLSNINSFCV